MGGKTIRLYLIFQGNDGGRRGTQIIQEEKKPSVLSAQCSHQYAIVSSTNSLSVFISVE